MKDLMLEIKVESNINEINIPDFILSESALDKIAKAVQEQIMSKSPVKTGALRDSIKILSSNNLRTIYSEMLYASFVNYGTALHKIMAKRKSLRYIMDGIIKYSKSVNHPGMKPTNFFLAQDGSANQDTVSLVQKILSELPEEDYIKVNGFKP